MYVPDDDNYIVDGENYAPPKPPQEKNNKDNNFIVKIILLIVIVLALGFGVYFLSSLFFNGGKKEAPKESISTTLSVDDPEIRELYEKVTYGRDSNTLNKYLKEQFVSLKDFSNYEKYYFALSGLKEKDLEEGEEKRYYSISDRRMEELMQSYFGKKVSYLQQGSIPIVLMEGFQAGNTLSLTYDVNQKKYQTTLTTTPPLKEKIIPVSMYSLESASMEDDVITLVERVIYIKSSISKNIVNYQVYRDYNHTMLIDSGKNIPYADYQKDPITIDQYKKQGNIITYQFKKSSDGYYFYQSSIEE